MTSLVSTLEDGKQMNSFEEVAVKGSTATATAGAATLSKGAGKVTTEALTTAAAAAYTLTLTNTYVDATDIVLASVAFGTCTAGVPVISKITPGSDSVVIVVQNEHASDAFDGTLVISFLIIKQ